MSAHTPRVIPCQHSSGCSTPAAFCQHVALYANAYSRDRELAGKPTGLAFYYYCAEHLPPERPPTDMSRLVRVRSLAADAVEVAL